MDYEYFLELLIGGVIKGSLYALIALGYTMVYGIIQLINFAHGEIYMISAFVAFVVAGVLTLAGYGGLSVLLLAGLVAMVYAAAYGYTLERISYRPLRNAPRLSPLISAIGASIFLMNYVQLAQTPDFLPFPALVPDFEFMEPVARYLSAVDLLILLVTVLTMVALTVLIKYTRIGKAMRATQQDMVMARLVGINVDRVISATFIIGSVLAAIGGVLIGSRTGQINAAIGFMAGIKAFTAAVLGGIGSIPGAVLGGLLLGVAETLGAGYISSAYEDVFAFGLLVLILIVRPAGLLGKAVRQKV
jgi:branched-chain amino acid transport system permease protein